MPLTAHIIYTLLILAVPRIIAAAPLSNDPPTISHSSSLTQIANTTGKELFNHIDILNHNSLLPRDHKQEKRVTRQYPARLCPPGWETVNSWCDYAHGPQVYQLTCKHSLIENVNVSEEGRCNNDEMCFDYIKYDQDQVTLRRAYCVSESDFYQLSLPDTGLASSQRGTAYFSASTVMLPSWDAHKTLEVILLDSQEQTTLNAASLRIQAQRLSNVGGHPSAQTLLGGLNECTDCSSIGLDSVPDGTEGFTLDIIMKTKVNEGKLLIGSIIT